MKQPKRLVLIFTVLITFFLAGCTSDISTTIIPNTTTTTTTTDVVDTTTTSSSDTETITSLSIGDVITDSIYNLSPSELEMYLDTLTSADSVVTTSLVMQSVVEVTVEIDYNYTQTYRTFGGTSTETISDTMTSQATAFFINEDGYLVTNAHVVSLEDYDNYPGLEITNQTIYFNFADSDEQFTATLIDYDTTLDLAVLKSDTIFSDQSYLTFFDIDVDGGIELYYGEDVLAIGNANGYGISVTSGIVSAPYRDFDGTSAIQTDAAINEGNSGGPLVNAFGSVVGINSFKIVTSTSESLGYAIPANVVLDYLDSVQIHYYSTTVRSY